jgi:hypothetical protein
MTDKAEKPQLPQPQLERRPLKEAGYEEKGALIDVLIGVPAAAAVPAIKAQIGGASKKDK